MERGTDCFRGRLEGPGGAPGVRDTFHCITTRLKSSKVIKSQQLLADVGTPRDLEGESWVVWILFYLRLTFSHKTLSKPFVISQPSAKHSAARRAQYHLQDPP
jgi:hypothetical protein